jgi:hypothetical protein
MKYYIYSPIGRTASKRIFDPLSISIQEDVEDSARMSIPQSTDGRCVLMRGGQDNINYTGQSGIDILDSWENSIAVHSHNTDCMPSSASGWKFFLSARKRKCETVLSKLIVLKSGVAHPAKSSNRRDDFAPFTVSVDEFDAMMQDCIDGETAFFAKVNGLGVDPTIIYLEDTFAEIQQKLGHTFKSDADVHDTNTISNFTAEDYITNYQELRDRYDSNLSTYQTKFTSVAE